MLVGKAIRDAPHRFELIEPARDLRIRLHSLKVFLCGSLEDQILEAVFGVEAEELSRRIPLGIVPDPNFEAIRVENYGALTVLLRQSLRIQLGLFATQLG